MQSISLKTINDLQFGNFFTKILPPIVSVILVVLIAGTLASVTWQLVPSQDIVPVPVSPVKSTSGVNKNIVSNAQSAGNRISNWHLFGVVPKNVPQPVVKAPEPIAPQEAPDTTLRLTLKGVVASKDMMSAWAIVADRSGNEDTYGIDSDLPGGAVLKEIYADRIILMHNGRLETLRLPESALPAARNNRATSQRNNNRRTSNRRTSRRSNVPSGPVNHLTREAAQVVKSYKDKLLSDPQSVMNTLRAEPYRQAGRLKGYRIFPGKDKQLFGQVGLEPGDVVTAVNGIALDSPLKGLEVMQNITDASEVSVDVLRNGVSQTYMVPLN